MASKVEIFNDALALCGETAIVDVSDTKAAPLIPVYETVRKAVLEKHPWNSAITRWQLGEDGTAPAWGWTRRFRMPTAPAALRILSIQGRPAFSREGDYILTNAAAPLYVVGIGDIDETTMSPALARFLAAELAASVVLRISDSVAYHDRVARARLEREADARAADTAEGFVPEVEQSSFVLAHMGYGGGYYGNDRLIAYELSLATAPGD